VRNKVLLLTTVVMMLIGISGSAFAWDGERQGFLLGLGIGLDATNNNPEYGDSKTEVGLGTDFKLGYAFTNQLMLLYTNKVGWLSIDSVIVTDGLSALGMNYYLDPKAPSFFFGGGLGVALRDAPFEEDAVNSTGFGFYAETGYEFARHWNVALTLRYGNPKSDDWSTSAISAALTVNVLGY